MRVPVEPVTTTEGTLFGGLTCVTAGVRCAAAAAVPLRAARAGGGAAETRLPTALLIVGAMGAGKCAVSSMSWTLARVLVDRKDSWSDRDDL